MLDSSDCSLSLDNLFFQKPVVHTVKPLHQESSLWNLEEAPSLSQIPATEHVQEEAESLYDFSQKPASSARPWHPFTELPALKNLSDFGHERSGCEETWGSSSSSSSSRRDSLWRGDGFRDHSQGGEDQSLQVSGPVGVGRSCLSVSCSNEPPLRRSLFKVGGWNRGGEADPPGISSSSRGPSHLPPRVTVGEAAPPPPRPPTLPSSASLLGSSAVSGRPSETPDTGAKRALVPPMTPRPLCIPGSSGCEVLRPVSEIPFKFRSVFKDFPFFNYVQSKALDDVLYTGQNLVACAPTGSGKTVLLELAIVRLLMESSEPWRDVKAVYIAPIKALCSQCFESWNKKFGPLGLSCKELTGDTEIEDFFEIQDSHIILTTPEKWDSMTRKWKDNCLLQLVRLFLIDEVHVVKDATRGATLEVVVSRMKAVHAYRTAQSPDAGLSMRFVAVSATIPNIADIADWLSSEVGPATFLEMDESHRPVKLRKVVLGFPCGQNQTEFKFDLSLNYKMANIIQTYSDQKPALVFCSTRKGAQQSAGVLAKDARFIMSIEHKQRLIQYANSLLDSKLRELLMLGVGYHHAGVALPDRKLVEEAFTRGDLPVLFTTRTLAMGVNLPAHLVVIKSTTQYVGGACEEYSEADLLQMIGRAGRPQFDTSATAVIMTKIQTRDKHAKLMNGMEIIESSLHSHLVEHLNAEIVLQTICDVNMALDWIRSTFLYIRALKNPAYYGFSADLDRYGIEAKLQGLCLKNLTALSSICLIDMDEDINIKPTESGKLMARYCIAFDTMKQFSQVTGTENLSDLINLVSKSREFRDIQLRVNERKTLNTLNRDKNRTTIRFPIEGKIKTSEMKVNCLIQAQLGSISIQEFGLTQDTAKIFRNGLRISKSLSEFLSQQPQTGLCALLNSLILAKCFRAKLWENSHYVSRQLEKIGQTLSTAMVNAGLTSFSKIEQTNARELELIVNRHPPFGNQIKESVIHLPKYEVTLEQLPRYSSATAEIVVKVNLKNQAELLSRRTAADHHYVSLIIGDADNSLVFLQKVTDVVLLKCGTWSKKIEVAKASKGEEISVNLISSEYVGLDIQQKFNVFYSGAKRFGTDTPYNLSNNPTGQRSQQSAANPPSTPQATPQRENPTEEGNKRQCNHFCKNKDLCGHDCCKVGVTVAKKRLTNQESGFSSYLRDLRSRNDTPAQTPVKRLKLKMMEEALPVNMQEFAYTPKEKLPNIARFETHSYETVDLTRDDCNIVHLDDTDAEYSDGDGYTYPREEAVQAPGSLVWQQPRTSSWSQNPEPRQSQMDANRCGYSQSSDAGASGAARCDAAPSSQIPTVNFDLGHEWDDWSDFDEESLVHASEMTSEPEPQRQATVQRNMTGFAAASPDLSLKSSHINLCMTPARTSLRTVPCLTTVRPQNTLTLDCNEKIPGVFSEVRIPESFPKQSPAATASRGLPFFSMSVPAGTSSGRSFNNKEEEAFFGIFDGIL